MKVVAAVRELETDEQYKDKVQFTLVPHTKEGFDAEVASFNIGSHGLVGINAEGKTVAEIEGHEFGKDEIVAAIDKVLDT